MKITDKLFFFILVLGLPLLSMGQHTVSIAIKDQQSSESIKGATCTDNTNRKVWMTDEEGIVRLPDIGRASLHISVRHINYKPLDTVLTIEPDGRYTLFLTGLARSLEQVEVFHTGYDAVPKERQTGSFVNIGKELLSRQTGMNVLDRLPAVTPGLMLDKATSSIASTGIRIRGLSSIRGQKEPLIILDDFPYDGDINNINPEDVETITVLRDAAASSIWGAKAGNGVIVITTTKAKKGQPTRISFSANMGVSPQPDLRYANVMDAKAFIEVERFLFDNNFYNSFVSSRNRPALSQAVELLLAHRENRIASAELEAGLTELAGMDGIADFENHVYGRSLLSQNFIQASGGKENYGWVISGGYDRSRDELDNETRRLTFRTNQRYDLAKGLGIDLNLRMNNQRNDGGKNGLDGIRTSFGNLPPYERLLNGDGMPRAIMYRLRPSAVEETSAGRLLDWSFVPLDDHQYMDRQDATKEININPTITYTNRLGFSVIGKYNYMWQQHAKDYLYDQQSYYVRDLINAYTQFQPDGSPLYIVPMGGIRDLARSETATHNARLQLGYNRRFGEHRVDALAGGELIATDMPSYNQVLFGFNSDTYTSRAVDLTQTYPHVISRARSYIPGANGIALHKRRFVSMFANASYSFRYKYVASVSLRRDASNFFGIAANDSWNPLGSVGLSWDLAKENFFNTALFPEFKLRATYGKSGNINSSMVALTTIAYEGTSFYTGDRMARVTNHANPELKWETVSTYNLGVDFSTLKGRLSANMEIYRKTGDDLFGTSPMDYTAGVGYSVVRNVAKMKTSGMDITLNSKNLVGRFSWDTNLNWSFNRDEVTEYFLTNTYGRDFVGNATNISAIEGKPVYGTYSYAWAGLDPQTGKARGYLQGEASDDYVALTGTATDISDLVFHGSAVPKMFGTLGNRFAYGNFDLDVRLLFKLSYFLRRSSIGYYSLFYDSRTHSDFDARWQQPGDEQYTDIPALTYPYTATEQAFYTNSSPLVYDASHIRLQYIRLGYQSAIGIGNDTRKINANFYLAMENLGLLWRKNPYGIDPDFPDALGNYPTPVRFSFGVKLNY